MNTKPIHSERHMRIACIGAGASGLCFAYKLQRSFQNFSLSIYEKGSDVGGVWLQNRYPGCECDYDAHSYTYSWEPKSDWSQVYASAKEIQGYFKDFATKYELYRYCKFNRHVLAADWDDGHGVWKVKSQDSDAKTTTEEFDIFINATGILSTCKWPDIPQLDAFQGVRMHSGAWDETIDLSGKKVCLIGNGSSGQQILKAIQPIAGHVSVFIRQPTWILGSFGETQRIYTPEELQKFKDDPDFLIKKRKTFESRVNSYFNFCLKDSPQQAQIRTHLADEMRKKLQMSGDKELDEASIIPNYAVGCRRPTPGVGYVESIASPNVSLIVGQIQKATETGFIDSKLTEYDTDVLICATGFDTSHRPPFSIHGLDGKDLHEQWHDRATAYLAIAVPNMPNYFVFYGPNNPFGSGAFLSTIEAQADYMLKMCDRWQTENIHSFAPKENVVRELQEHIDAMLEKTVWTDSCNSWYKPAGKASPPSLWPGSGLHYMESISGIRADDYDFQYKGNRFEWLGNGFSQIETDPQCDLAFYVRQEDNSEFLGATKRRRLQAAGPTLDPHSLHVFGPRDE